jgi:hypothetical protein
MSLFGELDVESAEDNPWLKPDGTYLCDLVGLSVKPTAKGDKQGLRLEFKIVKGEKKGRNITPWYWIPTAADLKSSDDEFRGKAATAVSQLKKTMMDMGVPAERINDLQAEDLMNMNQQYDVTIYNKNGSENVRSIAVADASTGSGGNPFE